MHVLHLARAGTSVLVVRVRRIRFNQLWSDRHRNDCHKGSFTHSSPEAGGLVGMPCRTTQGSTNIVPEHRKGGENVGKSFY